LSAFLIWVSGDWKFYMSIYLNRFKRHRWCGESCGGLPSLVDYNAWKNAEGDIINRKSTWYKCVRVLFTYRRIRPLSTMRTFNCIPINNFYVNCGVVLSRRFKNGSSLGDKFWGDSLREFSNFYFRHDVTVSLTPASIPWTLRKSLLVA